MVPHSDSIYWNQTNLEISAIEAPTPELQISYQRWVFYSSHLWTRLDHWSYQKCILANWFVSELKKCHLLPYFQEFHGDHRLFRRIVLRATLVVLGQKTGAPWRPRAEALCALEEVDGGPAARGAAACAARRTNGTRESLPVLNGRLLWHDQVPNL